MAMQQWSAPGEGHPRRALAGAGTCQSQRRSNHDSRLLGFSVERSPQFAFQRKAFGLKPVSSEAHVSRLVLHFAHTACTQADAPMMALGALSACVSAAACGLPASPLPTFRTRTHEVPWRRAVSGCRNTRVLA